MKVYFFATCLGGIAYSDTCVNAIKLLQNAGAEVIFKKDQTCCGQPSYNSGYYEDTKKIALHNISLFDKPYPIIIPSGSCAGVMKVDYLELFASDGEYNKVEEFCSRVYELSDFLVKELKVQYEDKGEKTKVTWHSNCHALRVCKSIESSKKLIQQLKNVELIELEREEECCGFGGTFSIKEPDISNAMVLEKIEDIKSRNVEYLISADAGCLMNISGAMKKNGINVKPVHLYDFIINRVNL
ncbi:(Fe-S)-binding protein [Helicobacter sp. MIT 14-3879]|uniref:(Fe-S)-binding protein n=1 Tax=Helicobacter sp. MIT 14-3879 TaxID=2040649 RepID=UPI000E1EEE71|nr:(Fe-S)-binding protein [Helicobacter sp. MIT 14-3879]RDU62423.1 oxidoreductase [Helicobacter sp. MIT 14-3879]